MADYEKLPNMGRPRNVIEPPGIDHLYPDRSLPLAVNLVVWACPGVPHGEQHWALGWQVGSTFQYGNVPVLRLLSLTREIGPQGQLDHLTNWGPKTRTAGVPTQTYGVFRPIATLSHDRRQRLEAIAAAEPVLKPNGWWNCQNWTVSILIKAIEAGVFTHQEVSQVLSQAGWSQPWRSF